MVQACIKTQVLLFVLPTAGAVRTGTHLLCATGIGRLPQVKFLGFEELILIYLLILDCFETNCQFLLFLMSSLGLNLLFLFEEGG
jgi:hypothetical protein